MATHTLLVADDSQTVQRIIEMACAGEDVEVVTVADGDLAIARINQDPPDIVLADIGMPGRNGYEVAAYVKGRADLAHIPVLLLAGMFEAADQARANALGCSEVLVKPLKPHHLMNRVRHWLTTAAVTVAAAPAATIPNGVPSAGFADNREADESSATATTAEDYFIRLDAAFKTLERPIGVRLGDATETTRNGASTAGSGEGVPTLQELLNRLPEETRTRLTPSPAQATAADRLSAPASGDSLLDAIAARVIDQLAGRDDLLDEIARRVARRQNPDDGR